MELEEISKNDLDLINKIGDLSIARINLGTINGKPPMPCKKKEYVFGEKIIDYCIDYFKK